MPEINCKICGIEFYVKPSHVKLGYGKYCSIECRTESQKKGKFVFCSECGKKIWKMPKEIRHSKSGKSFCSKSCQTKWRNSFFSGGNHPFWTGGENIYRKILTRSGSPQICKRCKINDKRILAVHHLDKNRYNNSLENLVWLCHNCHYLIHHDQNELDMFEKALQK